MSTSSRIFASLSGARTIGRLFSAINQVIYGIYDPLKPTLPLWSVDGSTAYGFRQFFNGYVFGPEGTSLAQLQDAVNAGQLPMIHANSAGVYPTLTIDDYLDAMYINVSGSQTIYSMYVRPAQLDPSVPSVPPIVPIDPPKPPVPPVVVDPCAEIQRKLNAAYSDLAGLKSDLEETEKDLDKEITLNDAVRKIIAGAGIPTRGGGAPMNALRKIKNLLEA